MAITNEFRNAVEANDVRLVRIMLKDSLVVDPTFTEFNQMIGLTNGMNGLFDTHDGEKLNYDTSTWTKDYMDEQMVQIVYNFSEERLDLLKNICKQLYGRHAVKIGTERPSQPQRNGQVSRKQVGTGVAVTGVAATVVGAVISQPIIIGAGVVAIVVGGAMIITDK